MNQLTFSASICDQKTSTVSENLMENCCDQVALSMWAFSSFWASTWNCHVETSRNLQRLKSFQSMFQKWKTQKDVSVHNILYSINIVWLLINVRYIVNSILWRYNQKVGNQTAILLSCLSRAGFHVGDAHPQQKERLTEPTRVHDMTPPCNATCFIGYDDILQYWHCKCYNTTV